MHKFADCSHCRKRIVWNIKTESLGALHSYHRTQADCLLCDAVRSSEARLCRKETHWCNIPLNR